MDDYYQILGISPNSMGSDIKKAYRQLSLKHHPDKNGGDATLFKKINEAYQILGNEEKKRCMMRRKITLFIEKMVII
jgi:molecular chaperone DnaJ